MWKIYKGKSNVVHKARHNPEPDFILVQVAFKGRLLTYQHNNLEEGIDIEPCMDMIKENVIKIVINALNINKNIKINVEMECEFMKLENEDFTMIHTFQLLNVILREKDGLDEYWDEQKDLFISRCDELQEKVSGWTLKNINYLRINIHKDTHLSVNLYVELPKWFKDKKACVNVKNSDNKCFMYSVISCLHQAKGHVDRSL